MVKPWRAQLLPRQFTVAFVNQLQMFQILDIYLLHLSQNSFSPQVNDPQLQRRIATACEWIIWFSSIFSVQLLKLHPFLLVKLSSLEVFERVEGEDECPEPSHLEVCWSSLPEKTVSQFCHTSLRNSILQSKTSRPACCPCHAWDLFL